LYLSLVIRPEDGRDLEVLPLMASVAAAEALKEVAGIETELRWPNDLFASGRKIGGILCESSFLGPRCEFAVVGIGVNVNPDALGFPAEFSSRATSVRAILGRAMDPFDVALAVVTSVEKWWERESRPRILQRWRELAGDLEGARVRVAARDGSFYPARISRLAEDGGLEVRLEDGTTRTLRSDDVHLQEEAERGAHDAGYYEEVESYFVSRRGSPLFITPSEWDLVWRWEQLGIPLAVVKEGIDRVFERPKTLSRPRRLGYCRQTVEAAFRRFREASLGGRAERSAEEGSGVSFRLAEISARLQELAAEWSEREDAYARFLERTADAVRSFSHAAAEAPDAIEGQLAAIDGKLLVESEAILGDAAREELRREAESSLESYNQRMPQKIYRAAVESAYRRRLRKKIGLPTLSLYA
jgi:BirA family biotin operon repressor/biotin-[acetyl-CoA-carboxylase] ligase